MNDNITTGTAGFFFSEIDYMVSHQQIRLATSEIEGVRIEAYRRSQYDLASEARKHGAMRCIGDTYGYIAAIDLFHGLACCATMMDAGADETDVRVVLTVNGEPLPECWLGDAQITLHAWMYRNGYVN